MDKDESKQLYEKFVAVIRMTTDNDDAVIKLCEKRYRKANGKYIISEEFKNILLTTILKIQEDKSNPYLPIKDLLTELKRYENKNKAGKGKAAASKRLLETSDTDSSQPDLKKPRRIQAEKLSDGEVDKQERVLNVFQPDEISGSSPVHKGKDLVSSDTVQDESVSNSRNTGSDSPIRKSSERDVAVSDAENDAVRDEVEQSGSVEQELDESKLNKENSNDDHGLLSGEKCKKKTKATEKQIKRLEDLLEKIRTEIEELQEKELTLDDLAADDSVYTLEDRYKKKFMQVWHKLCELKGVEPFTGRRTEKKFKFEGTRYPEINRKISKFINVNKIFPDFHDIKEIISRCNIKHHLHFGKKMIESLAKDAFTEVGNRLQKRRLEDFAADFGCHLTESFKVYKDPALFDKNLRRKLDQNKEKCKTKLDEVINKYAYKQDTGETSSEDVEEEIEDREEEEEEEKEEKKVMQELQEDLGEDVEVKPTVRMIRARSFSTPLVPIEVVDLASSDEEDEEEEDIEGQVFFWNPNCHGSFPSSALDWQGELPEKGEEYMTSEGETRVRHSKEPDVEILIDDSIEEEMHLPRKVVSQGGCLPESKSIVKDSDEGVAVQKELDHSGDVHADATDECVIESVEKMGNVSLDHVIEAVSCLENDLKIIAVKSLAVNQEVPASFDVIETGTKNTDTIGGMEDLSSATESQGMGQVENVSTALDMTNSSMATCPEEGSTALVDHRYTLFPNDTRLCLKKPGGDKKFINELKQHMAKDKDNSKKGTAKNGKMLYKKPAAMSSFDVMVILDDLDVPADDGHSRSEWSVKDKTGCPLSEKKGNPKASSPQEQEENMPTSDSGKQDPHEEGQDDNIESTDTDELKEIRKAANTDKAKHMQISNLDKQKEKMDVTKTGEHECMVDISKRDKEENNTPNPTQDKEDDGVDISMVAKQEDGETINTDKQEECMEKCSSAEVRSTNIVQDESKTEKGKVSETLSSVKAEGIESLQLSSKCGTSKSKNKKLLETVIKALSSGQEAESTSWDQMSDVEVIDDSESDGEAKAKSSPTSPSSGKHTCPAQKVPLESDSASTRVADVANANNETCSSATDTAEVKQSKFSWAASGSRKRSRPGPAKKKLQPKADEQSTGRESATTMNVTASQLKSRSQSGQNMPCKPQLPNSSPKMSSLSAQSVCISKNPSAYPPAVGHIRVMSSTEKWQQNGHVSVNTGQHHLNRDPGHVQMFSNGICMSDYRRKTLKEIADVAIHHISQRSSPSHTTLTAPPRRPRNGHQMSSCQVPPKKSHRDSNLGIKIESYSSLLTGVVINNEAEKRPSKSRDVIVLSDSE